MFTKMYMPFYSFKIQILKIKKSLIVNLVGIKQDILQGIKQHKYKDTKPLKFRLWHIYI
ncbi:hypothetical protein CB17B2540 [Clostridium botulinum B str. Eklund 17B (NRP)]|nr:hypothetical protein CB17B2540 [Clostridium botulinum B str. Eklund 17B (NRP)]